MTPAEVERSLLFNSLCNLGQFYKLKININPHQLEKDLAQFENNWCPYNVKKDVYNNRWGLPITSHSGDVMDNYHLNSFGYMKQYHDMELSEDNFKTPTQVYHALPEIKNIVDMFSPDIGRVHFLKIGAGGYFPPHRDHKGMAPEYIRLIMNFGKCKPENFVQMLDGKAVYYDPGFFYFANFQLEHSVFSFSDYVYAMILSVKLNQRTHDLIFNNLMHL